MKGVQLTSAHRLLPGPKSSESSSQMPCKLAGTISGKARAWECTRLGGGGAPEDDKRGGGGVVKPSSGTLRRVPKASPPAVPGGEGEAAPPWLKRCVLAAANGVACAASKGDWGTRRLTRDGADARSCCSCGHCPPGTGLRPSPSIPGPLVEGVASDRRLCLGATTSAGSDQLPLSVLLLAAGLGETGATDG